MSCFHVSARLRECLSRVLSRLRALFCVGAWCLDPGTHVLSFMCRVGVRTLALHVLCACSLEFARPRALLSTCVVFCVVARSLCFIGCVHSCYVLCYVARSLCFSLAACFHVVMSCVNTWFMSILISCVFVSCLTHGWWFVLCEHMTFVLVFCVPCALMLIVLSPPILFPDYWFICPTGLPSLPSSFAPFIISLCLQSCASSSLNVSCSCPALPCPVQPRPALPCSALPAILFSPRGSFSFLIFILCLIKAHLLHHWVLASSLHPTTLTYSLKLFSSIQKVWNVFKCVNCPEMQFFYKAELSCRTAHVRVVAENNALNEANWIKDYIQSASGRVLDAIVASNTCPLVCKLLTRWQVHYGKNRSFWHL